MRKKHKISAQRNIEHILKLHFIVFFYFPCSYYLKKYHIASNFLLFFSAISFKYDLRQLKILIRGFHKKTSRPTVKNVIGTLITRAGLGVFHHGQVGSSWSGLRYDQHCLIV